MNVKAIKTDLVQPTKNTLIEILDKSILELDENTVVAITSKLVSICEGRVVSGVEADKMELIKEEAKYYLLDGYEKWGLCFTLTNNTLIPTAGIDESNADGQYILWPTDAQDTANSIRKYLKDRFRLKKVGVVITDSTCTPMRWGTVGIALAYSGFAATNNYIGEKDLFGRPFEVSRAGVASGLAATAVLAMGEGTEQTPIAIITDVPFVEFQDHDPTTKELEMFYIPQKEDDLFAPFFNAVKWLPGKKK